MRDRLLGALLTGTALTLSMPTFAQTVFDANSEAQVGASVETNGLKNVSPTEVSSDSSVFSGSQSATANGWVTDAGFLSADANISHTGSEAAFFDGDTIESMHARGEATWGSTFTNNAGFDANFALAVTLPDHSVDAFNILGYDDVEVFSTTVTTTWFLDSTPIWSFAFGLQSNAGQTLDTIETTMGTGAFPDADCSFTNAFVASCSLVDDTGLIELGLIEAGRSFDLSVQVVAEASAPGKTLDLDGDDSILDPFGNGFFVISNFDVGSFGTDILISDPAQLLPPDPQFQITQAGTPIPEPAAAGLLGTGLLGLLWARRRRSRTS